MHEYFLDHNSFDDKEIIRTNYVKTASKVIFVD